MPTIYILFNLPHPNVAAAQILHIYIERHLYAGKQIDRLGYIITSSATFPSHLFCAGAHYVQSTQSLHFLPPPHYNPLLAQPALWRLALALQNHSVRLQPTRHVVPRGRNQLVFSAEILDFGFEFGL